MMPQNQVVLDLETKKTFDEIGGRNPAELGVTVIGTYSYATGEYRAFWEHEMTELEQFLSKASRVIGFNIRRFDFPAPQPHLRHIRLNDLPALDLLEELEKILGHRVSLQSVAIATLNVGKSGSGLDAIQYYRTGDFEKLTKYCLDDVRITKDIFEFGKKWGTISYLSKDGRNKMSAKVTWRDPVVPANLSLF